MIEQAINELTTAIRELTAVCEKSLALSTEALTLTTENNALAREAITLSLHAASGLNTSKAPTKRKKGDPLIDETAPTRLLPLSRVQEDPAETPAEVSPTDVAELLAHEAEAMSAKTPTDQLYTVSIDPDGKTEVTPAAETPTEPVVTVEDLKAYVLAAMEKTDAEGKKAINTKLFELNKELGVERVSFCPAEKCAEYLTAMKRWF